ncbi:MAG TPA: DUF4476 domain-containing protein [Chitinophagaceae bacterium]|nr:DUF4476 domain-containing protein [Chitinophagaceae bacterium]
MKQVSILLIGLLTAFSAQAQQNLSAVTITVTGNKNLQVAVDGRDYDLPNSTSVSNKTTFVINNLSIAQHAFQITRTDQNTNRSDRISTIFNLRSGYDMRINVNQNGSIELIEIRKTGTSDDGIPMNSTNFNNLLKNVRNQKSTAGRRNLVANAFNNTRNYFITSQATQLLQLINSESVRLQLAKLSYRTITDRENFYQLYSLLNSEASRNELADYVNNYYEEDNVNVAMADADFNSLYQTIQQQRPVSTQMNSLTNSFNNASNYFTTYQASRLIQLVSAESNRLQLAKLSYRSITDRANFSQIYNLLNTQAGRSELEAYVNNYNTGSNFNIAMSDANFNSLYQTIQQQSPVSTQMNSLTNAFNNSSNYFTTYQASRLIQLVGSEGNRLQLAKLSYRSITDRNNFYQVYDLFNSQASKNELEAYVNNYSTGSTANVAMSDANFNSLYQTIQQQWPVSTQMNSLTSAFNNTSNYFTTYQVSRLIQLVSAESNRLQLAKLSFRSITDRNNFYQVYDLFNSQASKNELEAYVNNYSTGSTANVAMTDANFNSLYQTIQQQWPVSTQMNSLTNAFDNTNNYFTIYQASRLIQLVSAESNRLQLAKLSYRSITDRNNFYQVYDLFNSQASKDELAAYVNNYSSGNGNLKVPMPDADFNNLYQTIQLQFFPGERMSSLTNAFNNTSNYFTTAQAEKLIPLVSLESNKLQLAKLSYRAITDRSNFSQLYDLFASQASRNELDAYVKAYKD